MGERLGRDGADGAGADGGEADDFIGVVADGEVKGVVDWLEAGLPGVIICRHTREADGKDEQAGEIDFPHFGFWRIWHGMLSEQRTWKRTLNKRNQTRNGKCGRRP